MPGWGEERRKLKEKERTRPFGLFVNSSRKTVEAGSSKTGLKGNKNRRGERKLGGVRSLPSGWSYRGMRGCYLNCGCGVRKEMKELGKRPVNINQASVRL